MGFSALLPGGEVAVGDTWKVEGDLLNIQDCGNLLATFKLEEIVVEEGERCARITGTISNWPGLWRPEFRCELLHSLERGLPVRASGSFESPSRTDVVTTRLLRVEPKKP